MISLKSLFMQFRDVPRLWKISKFDTLVWLVCCIATLSNDVMTGLTISIAFTLLSVVLREQWPKVFHIGKARSDNIFKPIYRYSDFDGLPSNITIVRFEAPLHFVNVARFGEAINELIQLEPTDENCNNTKAEERTSYKELAQKESTVISMEGNEITGSEQIISTKRKKRRFIIVDCGAISIIDVMGIEALRHVYQDANRHSVDIFFADVSETILDTLDTINFFEEVPKSVFFPDLNQAVIFASSPVPSE
ncbi:hypothetical protein AB6A40_010701 [Gnathostoma spinigerum]|uniref:STAS domain-containing protein n=1 Tax=Gnathostoma spinigerum TaxID=75299 RepID=A0ABD6F375_9BILA